MLSSSMVCECVEVCVLSRERERERERESHRYAVSTASFEIPSANRHCKSVAQSCFSVVCVVCHIEWFVLLCILKSNFRPGVCILIKFSPRSVYFEDQIFAQECVFWGAIFVQVFVSESSVCVCWVWIIHWSFTCVRLSICDSQSFTLDAWFVIW
jgi:hypothetical protein